MPAVSGDLGRNLIDVPSLMVALVSFLGEERRCEKCLSDNTVIR